MYTISEKIVRRWVQNHRNDPKNGSKPKKGSGSPAHNEQGDEKRSKDRYYQ